MDDDDQSEIIPPGKQLPSTRDDHRPAPISKVDRMHTGGVVSSWITRWRADSESQALDSVAKRHRSEADVIKAYGELADSFEKTARKVNRVRKLPDILALDDAKFAAEQEDEYARIADEREEREHRREKTKLRRERELEEAQRAIVEAERGRFNSEQGLENQQRLKQVNLEIWENRKLSDLAEAERIRRLTLEDLGGAGRKDRPSLMAEFEALRDRLVTDAAELAADGKTDEAQSYRTAIVELDIAAARLRGQ